MFTHDRSSWYENPEIPAPHRQLGVHPPAFSVSPGINSGNEHSLYFRYVDDEIVLMVTSSAKGIGQKPVPFALPVGGNRTEVN